MKQKEWKRPKSQDELRKEARDPWTGQEVGFGFGAFSRWFGFVFFWGCGSKRDSSKKRFGRSWGCFLGISSWVGCLFLFAFFLV